MEKKTLDWLNKKSEFIEQMSGKGTDEEARDFVFRKFVEIALLEQDLRELNQEISVLVVERDAIGNSIMNISKMILDVVSAKIESMDAENDESNAYIG